MNKEKYPTVPDVVRGFAERALDKHQPQFVRDNNRRTLEDIEKFIKEVLKKA